MVNELLEYLFGAASFMPHGFCLLWRPDLVAVHVVADVLTAVAYFTIPAGLFLFQRRRTDLQFRGMVLLFAAFITLCGLSHAVDLVTLWQPAYGLEGLIKLATGIVSAITAVVLWRALPTVLSLPSPAMLREANERLVAENQARELAERELRIAHDQLERRVIERTTELADVNRKLADALLRQTIYHEHSPLAVMELTRQHSPEGWRIKQWSGRAEAMLGWPTHEVIGRTTKDIGLVYAEDLPGARRATAALLSGRISRTTIEQRFVTRTGDIRHGRWWVACQHDEGDGAPSILVLLEDVTEQADALDKLHHMAFHDALTGLLNRPMFHERLGHALNRARREKRQVAVMLLDLDRFKQVNDTLGHAAGDTLLQQVAGRLVGVARADDGWARLGGDEFALVQEGIAGAEGAETAARRILAALEVPFTVMGRSIDVRASIGIAVWEDPAIGQNDLLRLADDALYTAKASGRGCYRLAGAGSEHGLREHASPFPYAGSLGEAISA